jgi:KDO2-lipid IV(A) lauroyltransferase
MELFLYWLARLIIGALRRMPLCAVAKMGRGIGAVVYWCDFPHRKRALTNLTACFSNEKSPAEITALAKENFRRIGENFCCAVKTATMTECELRACCEMDAVEAFPRPGPGEPPQTRIVALGHFGNFEIWARLGQLVPGYRCATTYRALRQKSLNNLLQSLRAHSGCMFFERRSEGGAIRAALGKPGLLLGLLADQRAGESGLRLPFFGRDCSTSAATAIYALRYRCPLHVGVCYRTAPGHWDIKVSNPIPTFEDDRPRSTAAIMLEVNKIFEQAVRRDPANWFWVHNRWKNAERARACAVNARDETLSPEGAK